MKIGDNGHTHTHGQSQIVAYWAAPFAAKKLLYKCSNCEYKTAHKHHLKSHNKSIHEGIRFKCNECGKLLSCKTKLQAHYKFYHDGISLKCSEENCNREFAQKDSLDKHIMGIHQNH